MTGGLHYNARYNKMEDDNGNFKTLGPRAVDTPVKLKTLDVRTVPDPKRYWEVCKDDENDYRIYLFFPNGTYYLFGSGSKPNFLENGAHFAGLVWLKDYSDKDKLVQCKKYRDSGSVIGFYGTETYKFCSKLENNPESATADQKKIARVMEQIIQNNQKNIKNKNFEYYLMWLCG